MKKLQRAHNALQQAVKKGLLKRPSTCSVCGAGGKIVGHHEDYRKPLSVIWLCATCHGNIHAIARRPEQRFESLSPTQTHVLKLLSEGLSNREIAASLKNSVRTIETHRERIYLRTQTRNVIEAIHWAIAHGYLPEWRRAPES